MNNVDIVFCALPALFLDRAPGAPALLKATAQSAGYTSAGIDLSIEFFINQANCNVEKFNQLSLAFVPHKIPTRESTQAASQWVKESIDLIKQYNPRIVGLSIFTVFQHRAALMLSVAIRQELPQVKIILGGYGATMIGNGLQLSNSIKKIDLLKPFSQLLEEKGLIDKHFTGSALEDLVGYLHLTFGGSEDFRHKFKKEKKILFNTPIPDYDDYKFDKYVWNDGVALPVTGSRGCVRKCTFCDVPGQFGKFMFRPGQDIADEIIYLSQKYNVNTFEFTDSLVNGSLKSFRDWLTVIAAYNDSLPADKRVKWFGQYICRPQSETPKDIYELIVKSGASNLVIGVESGNNEVLKAMDKRMTVQDAYDEFDQFEKHGIQAHVLILACFYNETWDRFLDTLKLLVRLQYYVASGVVTAISPGTPLFINNSMPLYDSADELGIMLDPYNTRNWTIKDDPENTQTERWYRRLIMQLVLDKLGIPLNGNSILNLHQGKAALEQIKEDATNGKS